MVLEWVIRSELTLVSGPHWQESHNLSTALTHSLLPTLYGVQENDKILTINSKTPHNVQDAVGVIKQAVSQIKLVVLREEYITINEAGSIEINRVSDVKMTDIEIAILV